MRDLGTPVYGKAWFHEILSTFPENARMFCVWLGDQPVAASYVFWHGDTMEVPSASALRSFNPLCAEHAPLLGDAAVRRSRADSVISISAARPPAPAPTTSSGSGGPSRMS